MQTQFVMNHLKNDRRWLDLVSGSIGHQMQTLEFFMKLEKSVLLILFFSVLLSYNAAIADRHMRCQGSLVSIGDTTAQVLDKCGQPDKIDQWKEYHNGSMTQIYDYKHERYIAPQEVPNPILMQRWTYNLGENQFIRFLYFQDGELIRIKTGERGGD
jgi:Protein of unknown function (DUF2845)